MAHGEIAVIVTLLLFAISSAGGYAVGATAAGGGAGILAGIAFFAAGFAVGLGIVFYLANRYGGRK